MQKVLKEKYQIFIDGKEYQDRYLNLIASAKSTIRLHTYIFQLDNFGIKVKELLVKKAEEGVHIEIFLDYLGSFQLPKDTFRNIKNINFKYFNPFSFPSLLRVGRRLHYKVLIVDISIAFVGGINVTDGNEPEHPKHARLDFAVLMEGSIVDALDKYCSTIFCRTVKSRLKKMDLSSFESDKISFKVNDWLKERKQITSSYYSLIENSKNEIVLIHGYFFPSFKIMRQLKRKVNEGVSVVIVLPKYSDWNSWVWAAEHLYRKLINNNIKVLEWQLSNLHGKMAIFDKKFITLGSHNLNYTSSYGNLEINVEIHDEDFAKNLSDGLIKQIIARSKKITHISQEKQNFKLKWRNMFFYSLLMSISVVSVNYIKVAYQLTKMKPFQLISFFTLVFIGLVGIVTPILPGIPFLIAALVIYMRTFSFQPVDKLSD